MAFVIAEPCIGVKDTACVDACPSTVFTRRKIRATTMDVQSLMQWRNSTSIPLSALIAERVPVCPVSAIFAMDDLPEKWRHFAEIDASYVVGGKFQGDKFKK
jgi:ferredoxin